MFIVPQEICILQRSAKRRGCLLSYSQAEPGRKLTQPSPRLLAEPCIHVEFIQGPAHEEKLSAEDILTLVQLLQVESHDVPLTGLLGLSIIILIFYRNYPMG